MKTYLLLLAFVLGFSSSGFSSIEQRLEGIVFDPKSPADAFAVINGQPLRTGDLAEGYTVVSINTQTAVLKNIETGEEKTLALKTPEPLPAAAPAPASEVVHSAAESSDLFRKVWEGPSRAVNRFLELKALRDLAIVHNAAVAYFAERQIFPDDFDSLIEAGLLPESYKPGIRGPYQFRMLRVTRPDDFGIHADPVQKNSKLRHFFVGVDAVIREDSGLPANAKSRPHDY